MGDFRIKDPGLAQEGRKKIEWASFRMPVLNQISGELEPQKPLKGFTISACLHVTPETAVLCVALRRLGAEVFLSPSNPLSTKDEIAASLVVDFGISVFAVHGESKKDYYDNLKAVASRSPQIILDDGGDLTKLVHEGGYWESIIGGTEETTTGVVRLRAMEREGVLKFPVVAVNESMTKHMFDNRYGTGQSTIDGILRATNILLSNSTVVVAGYGWCGKGITSRARGMGARVIVTEIDPIRALEAHEDGFIVKPMIEAVKEADVIVTATGCKAVVTKEHFEVIKDGCILCNAGHFDVEVDVQYLYENSTGRETIRDNLEKIVLKNGKTLYLIAEGRLVNLAAAEGHPADVMDLSFSNQLLAAVYLKEAGRNLEPRVYTLPGDLDRKVAALKLKTLGISIDELSQEQRSYLISWREGT